jgi:hypothetical protein
MGIREEYAAFEKRFEPSKLQVHLSSIDELIRLSEQKAAGMETAGIAGPALAQIREQISYYEGMLEGFSRAKAFGVLNEK